MPLVDLDEVSSLLRCPRCGHPLEYDASRVRCGSSSCAYSRDQFPAAGRWPVLVDFDRSVLRRSSIDASPESQATIMPRWRADRVPKLLRSAFVKPPNRVAWGNVAALLSLLSADAPIVLVIGGGTVGNGMQALYRDKRARVVGFDIYASPLTQFIADAHQIPLAESSVDAVVIQAVLEHVLEPPGVVDEIHRVLKPGGLVYAETAFMQQVHAGAHDFTRYTASGHRYLFRAFEEIATGPVAGPGTQLLWSIDHLVRGLLRSHLAGKLARAGLFWLRYLDRLVPAPFAMDSASAYYFLGRVSERKLTPQEAVQYYRGAQRADNRPSELV